MRTFHTGGVAGEDITHGLPRVQELFEARKPKGQAVLAEISGTMQVTGDKMSKTITIHDQEGNYREYVVSAVPSFCRACLTGARCAWASS